MSDISVNKFLALNAEAKILKKEEKYDEAFQVYNKFLLEEQATLAKENSYVLIMKSNKAKMLLNMELYEESLRIFTQVYDIRNKKLGSMHLDTIKAKLQVATAMKYLNKNEDALKLCNENLNLVTYEVHQLLYLDHIQLRVELLERLERISDCLDCYKTILKFEEQYFHTGHFTTLATKLKISSTLVKLRQLEEAIQVLNDVINTVDFKKIGIEDFDVIAFKITQTKAKIELLQELEKPEDVLNTIETLLELEIEKYGENHREVYKSKNNRATLLMTLGKYEEALRILNEVIIIMKNIYGDNFNDDYLSVRHNRARAMLELGHHESALIELQSVFKKREKNLGVEHINTISTKSNIIKVLFKTEKFNEAMNYQKDLINISKKINGENHLETLYLIEDKAELHIKLGQRDRALSLLNYILQERVRQQGKNHPHALQTLTSILMLNSVSCQNEDEPAVQITGLKCF